MKAASFSWKVIIFSSTSTMQQKSKQNQNSSWNSFFYHQPKKENKFQIMFITNVLL
jgi:hypothetical protein